MFTEFTADSQAYFFLMKNISCFSYKRVSGRNGDHEWCRMTNAFILCVLLLKVEKRHAVNREGSFNLLRLTVIKMNHLMMRKIKDNSCHQEKKQIKKVPLGKPVGVICEVGEGWPKAWKLGKWGMGVVTYYQLDTPIHHPTPITTILMPLEIQCHDG